MEWPEQSIGKCCHTVLSMISGVAIEKVVELSKTVGLGGDRLSGPCIRVMCKKLGVKVGDWQIYKGWHCEGNPFPPTCIITTWLNDGESYEMQDHVILRKGNWYYDPYHYGKRILGFPANQIPNCFLEIN